MKKGEQTSLVKSENDEFTRLVQQVEIGEIALLSSSSEIYVPWFALDPSKIEINLSRQIDKQVFEEFSLLHCEIAVNLIGNLVEPEEGTNKDLDDGGGSNKVFDIKVKFGITYTVEELATFSDETLNLFATKNAWFNGYPFLREIITSTMARMHIPPYTLPLFKRPNATENAK